MSTKFFHGFSTSSNSLETRLESGRQFKPVLGGNIELLQDEWSSCVNGTSLVISDDSASPVDQLDVIDKIEDQAFWYWLP